MSSPFVYKDRTVLQTIKPAIPVNQNVALRVLCLKNSIPARPPIGNITNKSFSALFGIRLRPNLALSLSKANALKAKRFRHAIIDESMF